jgi:hypothetical protein
VLILADFACTNIVIVFAGVALAAVYLSAYAAGIGCGLFNAQSKHTAIPPLKTSLSQLPGNLAFSPIFFTGHSATGVKGRALPVTRV